jgi:acyl carrier protein
VNREQLLPELLDELAGMLGQDVGVDEDLLFEGGLDSFGIMQVVAFLEDTYSIRVPDDKLATANFATAATIVAWVLPLGPTS